MKFLILSYYNAILKILRCINKKRYEYENKQNLFYIILPIQNTVIHSMLDQLSNECRNKSTSGANSAVDKSEIEANTCKRCQGGGGGGEMSANHLVFV